MNLKNIVPLQHSDKPQEHCFTTTFYNILTNLKNAVSLQHSDTPQECGATAMNLKNIVSLQHSDKPQFSLSLSFALLLCI